jgi:hypothetical protein
LPKGNPVIDGLTALAQGLRQLGLASVAFGAPACGTLEQRPGQGRQGFIDPLLRHFFDGKSTVSLDFIKGKCFIDGVVKTSGPGGAGNTGQGLTKTHWS